MIETSTPFAIRVPRRIKGLRVTSEHFARREENRKTLFPDGFLDEYPVPEVGSLFNITELLRPLYQEKPSEECTFKDEKWKWKVKYSLSNSLETNQKGAWKEMMILRRFGRIPTKELRIHLYHEYTADDKKVINKLRAKIFRVLRDNGIEAVANIELTLGKDGKPNGRVHFHILTDDPRSEDELRELFNDACERQGLVRDTDRIEWNADHLVWDEDFLVGNMDADFRVDYRPLPDGYGFFKYFTKNGCVEKVILFQKDLGMQKFYYIGWGFEKGEKKRLWDEFLEEKYPNYPKKLKNELEDELFEKMKDEKGEKDEEQ